MNLFDIVKLWDTNLFLFINGIHVPFFDGFMYAVSYKFTWLALYVSVLYLVIKHWNREAVWVIAALILCIVISDQVSSGLLKDLVKRLRPSHAEDLKGLVHLVRGYSGGKYGFASSHAANAVGFALLSSLIFKRKIYAYAIFSWAIITAYSRIYLGVHYPLDILGGVFVGTVAAFFCYWLIRKYRPSILEKENSMIEKKEALIPVLAIMLSFLGIITYSIFF